MIVNPEMDANLGKSAYVFVIYTVHDHITDKRIYPIFIG